MKFGSVEIFPLEYGRFKLDGGAMFGVVPKVLWQEYAPADENNQIQMALRGLLIRTGTHNLLVDTGVGHKMSEKLNTIYAVDHSRFSMAGSLHQHGLRFEDITAVILTHLHFDHTGGATRNTDSGDVRPTFPNALYYVQQEQLQWALNPSERDRASYLPENFLPLRENGSLRLLEGDQEIAEGISVVTVHGHTPGQQLVRVTAAGQTLLYCGDLIPTAAHIPLPWIMSYDLYPLRTLEEKKRILPRAVQEGWILFFEHDPSIIAARVIQDGKGYRIGEVVLKA